MTWNGYITNHSTRRPKEDNRPECRRDGRTFSEYTELKYDFKNIHKLNKNAKNMTYGYMTHDEDTDYVPNNDQGNNRAKNQHINEHMKCWHNSNSR